MCDSKESKFIKKQGAEWFLISLELKSPLCKIPISGDILCQRYKVNEKVNNILSPGDKFIPEMLLRQLGFTCNACVSFSKNKEKNKETGYSKCNYQNYLNKGHFQHYMAYRYFKDLSRRTTSEVLYDKA